MSSEAAHIAKALMAMNLLLQDAGLKHKAHFEPAEDDTVDSQFEFHLLGVPSHISIQCCGGLFSVNEHFYEDGMLTAVKFHHENANLWRATQFAITLIMAVVS